LPSVVVDQFDRAVGKFGSLGSTVEGGGTNDAKSIGIPLASRRYGLAEGAKGGWEVGRAGAVGAGVEDAAAGGGGACRSFCVAFDADDLGGARLLVGGFLGIVG
jgi:hypothetical protein